jgi:prepilin peptidase CpaA
MTPLLFPPVAVVLAAALLATITDLRAFKIHNTLTLPLLVSGLVYHGVMGGSPALLSSVQGMLFGFAILFLFYLLGGMGGGDVKLMAGVGAWLGMPLTFLVFVVSALAAGMCAVILIIATGRTRETWVNLKILWFRIAAIGHHLGAVDRVEAYVKRPYRRGRLIPFAAMVLVGTVGTLVWAWLLTQS